MSVLRREKQPAAARPGQLLRSAATQLGTMGLIVWAIIFVAGRATGAGALGDLPTMEVTAPLTVQWSCPSTSDGWMATVVWPAGPGAGYWGIETAPSTSGPWSLASNGFGGHPAQVKHLAAGRPEWVRAGALSSLASGGPALTMGEVIPPVGC